MSTTTPTEPTPPTSGEPAFGPLRPVETAPSATIAELPTVARMAGMVGLFALVLGAAVVISTKAVGPRWFPEGWGYLSAAFGIALMLYHAIRDPEPEVRRMYGAFGAGWLLFGLGAAVIPGPVFEAAATKEVGYNLMPWGVGGGLLALLFLIPFVRQETDETYRGLAVLTMLVVGGALVVLSPLAGVFRPEFLTGPGLALALLGLGFICAYLGQVDTSEGVGYQVAFALGAIGAAVAVYALARAALPTLLYEGPNVLRKPNGAIDTWRAVGRGFLFLVGFAVAGLALSRSLPPWARGVFGVLGLAWVVVLGVATLNANTLTVPPAPFLIPSGVVLMGVGLLYLMVALGICSDNQFVTLTRRELASYFFSPIGYLVLGGMAVCEWQGYMDLINTLSSIRSPQEPIVRFYFVAILPVFGILVEVPGLTMRLMAEERRSGTLEVLLTAPVSEASIILSKFLATWLFFLITWVPSAMFLVALRVETGVPFDYRPLLSFYLALAAQGVGFLAIGLFFSTLTRNQIVAFVFTFVVMLGFLLCYMLREEASPVGLIQFIQVFLGRLSFIHVWRESLSGQLPVRDVLLWISVGVFFLFLSVKVLEIRKWS